LGSVLRYDYEHQMNQGMVVSWSMHFQCSSAVFIIEVGYHVQTLVGISAGSRVGGLSSCPGNNDEFPLVVRSQDRLELDGLASVEHISSNVSSRSCRVMYQRLRATIAYVSSLWVSEVYFLIDGVTLFIMRD
jgi:hypothetical protein